MPHRIVRSMTGHGHAKQQAELGIVAVEIRTVNNRGFKCSLRLSDSLASLEAQIESLARSMIHRGTVTLSVSLRLGTGESFSRIDAGVLRDYVDQLVGVREATGKTDISIDLSSLMTLPGVIVSTRDSLSENKELWGLVRSTIVLAIENLNEMREIEGGRMADSMIAECEQIMTALREIQSLAPQTCDHYRARLEAKIKRLLEERNLQAAEVDILRELQLYADRVDVSEEAMRLGSHLEMFVDVLRGKAGDARSEHPEPTGRKLDFVIQEMFRETNTIGSKASDAEISGHVVEIKCAIERMRELVQNLE